jgi:hypothetical protein
MMTTITGKVVDLGNLEWSLLNLASCLHYCWKFQLIMFIGLKLVLCDDVCIHSQGFSLNRVIPYNNLSLILVLFSQYKFII